MTGTSVSLMRGALIAPLATPVAAIPLIFIEALTGVPWSSRYLIGMLPLIVIASVISVIVGYAAMCIVGLPLALTLRRFGILNPATLCSLTVPFGAALLPSLGVLVVVPMPAQIVGGGVATLAMGFLFCRANRIRFREHGTEV
jgi:hypothetical protein